MNKYENINYNKNILIYDRYKDRIYAINIRLLFLVCIISLYYCWLLIVMYQIKHNFQDILENEINRSFIRY